MSRREYACKVCEHQDVELINSDLAQGFSIDAVAIGYAVPKSSVYRHKMEHLLTGRTDQGAIWFSLTDVLNIPLQMKERSQLVSALLSRALEPLYGNDKKKKEGLEFVQTGFIIRLLRLQQMDEQTVLKVTGILKDDSGPSIATTKEFSQLREGVDAAILRLTGGDEELAAQARVALADAMEAQGQEYEEDDL